MSIVAPSTPGGNRSFTGRDIGASDGRRRLVEAVSSYQEPTPRLSLNALLQHESIEFLKENLTELLRFADQFTHQPGQDACPVNEHQLLAMIRLSRDVSTSLDKIGSLREQSMSMPFFAAAAAYIPVKPMSFIARKRRQERMARKKAHKCRSCQIMKTPQWRPGPDGPRSLCNVCGLMYSKRQQRYAQQTAKTVRQEAKWI